VIIGGGDPTLSVDGNGHFHGAARLDDLAAQVRTALGGVTPTKVIVDSSLFVGSNMGPGWLNADLNNGVMSRITALMTDGGRVHPADMNSNTPRFTQPDMSAGQSFAQLLGVPESQVVSATAPAGAKELGSVLSLPISRIVEDMLLESDNVVADNMARQVALAKNMPASFAGGADATKAALADLGVPTSGGLGLVDGSGLSDDNKLSVNQLTTVLFKATSPQYPQLSALLSGLPVAGYSGTLDTRRMGTAAGEVRAKTGTLSHVNALAGTVVDADGRLLIFAVVADETNSDSNKTNIQNALDAIAESISTCGCK
jgi:D-alanyl-D-alanine carboxypeptidase/D-alanyl-D-alanine-endopeptidase (penicillin-binding protein 4)